MGMSEKGFFLLLAVFTVEVFLSYLAVL